MYVRTMNASKHGISDLPDSYYSMQWNAPSIHTMRWALYKNFFQLHAFVTQHDTKICSKCVRCLHSNLCSFQCGGMINPSKHGFSELSSWSAAYNKFLPSAFLIYTLTSALSNIAIAGIAEQWHTQCGCSFQALYILGRRLVVSLEKFVPSALVICNLTCSMHNVDAPACMFVQ